MLNAFIFKILNNKIRYNNRYKIILIKIENKIFIKLYHEYNLFNLENVKLFN